LPHRTPLYGTVVELSGSSRPMETSKNPMIIAVFWPAVLSAKRTDQP
jgi:hypothetical protein